MNFYIAILCEQDYHYFFADSIVFQANSDEEALEKAKEYLKTAKRYIGNTIDRIYNVGKSNPTLVNNVCQEDV
jgi:hypothetical protein